MTINEKPVWEAGSSASVAQTAAAIDQACKRRGSVYAQYSCKYVSWDDASRTSTSGGGLSCWGSNISDTYLKVKEDGRQLFTVRPSNWNEKLGSVPASELAVLVGNHEPNGTLQPVALRDVLQRMGRYGNYAGVPRQANLLSEKLDHNVSIRFQTTFLPVERGNLGQTANVEFATEVYNYQTHDERNPKNLVLLCTTQGLAVQQDGSRLTRLYHHNVKHGFGFGSNAMTIHRHWLEAERTQHFVGGPQHESATEKADALKRGKATSSVIGPRALGERFNVLMTIQVPLDQPKVCSGPPYPGWEMSLESEAPSFMNAAYGASPAPPQFGAPCGAAPGSFYGAPPPPPPPQFALPNALYGAALPSLCCAPPGGAPAAACSSWSSTKSNLQTGVSNAARVSRGSYHDTWKGLMATSFCRDPEQHIAVTVVLYHVVAGGVPKEADVVAAIDDLELLYASCRARDRSSMSLFNDHGSKSTSAPNPFPSPFPQPFVNPNAFPEPLPPLASFGQRTYTSPMSDVPQNIREKAAGLPLSVESVNYLCTLGVRLLDDPSSDRWRLFESFCYFRLGNDMHIRMRGVPSAMHLYNIACCCSRMSQTHPDSNGLVPLWCCDSATVRASSLSWLMAAVGAGWHDANHIMADPDLQAVRVHHGPAFTLIVQMAQQAKVGF